MMSNTREDLSRVLLHTSRELKFIANNHRVTIYICAPSYVTFRLQALGPCIPSSNNYNLIGAYSCSEVSACHVI
jgi:hypothetical protein